jgi:hypothetical protein
VMSVAGDERTLHAEAHPGLGHAARVGGRWCRP